ncbi:MAG: hypothetical protein ACD_7C00024G0004 [uncultured bacterium]|nr:MAG: hypothetical protein ACD_7C00024G0004 [uncultured bacterium]
MKTYAFRLQPSQDLKIAIKNYVRENQIKAGVILCGVGSLNCATLRMADENITKTFNRKFGIVSLGGTLSPDGCHLHIALSDKDGNVIGGHLNEGCIIYTTAEIVIGEIENLNFSRSIDEKTGFKELIIQSNPSK